MELDRTGRHHIVSLATDLYQLTMGASYAALDMDQAATFSLFVRELPENRSFLVVAGLGDALDRLQSLRFDHQAIDYLASTGHIRDDFLHRLSEFRFTGDVRAVPEGRVVFANEPIVEVQAPMIEAQLAETLMINAMHFPTAVATKAARCVAAAPGKRLIDFGLRRTPGVEAGLDVARVAYLVGFAATSNLLAGERFGIPVAGTVAHSFIQAFSSEIDAFRAFARTYPGPVTLLIDTYDTIRGAHHAVTVAREFEPEGKRLEAVRLDSGDLVRLSRAVREILDSAGLHAVRIVASGGLDEYELAQLTRAGVPIDVYGVGTRLGTSADAPNLDMVYKLVEYAGVPTLKLSEGKESLIGSKQVWRRRNASGIAVEDRISARDEPHPGDEWEPLLDLVMQDGVALPGPTLEQSRRRHRDEMERLPADLLRIEGRHAYPVSLSDTLVSRQKAAVDEARRREGLRAG